VSSNPRAEALLAQSIEKSAAKIDRVFPALFLVEWASRIGLAYFRPAYEDALFTAIVIGAFISSVPSVLVAWKPGTAPTRHAIAVAHMLGGALLVHRTNGQDSTQIHSYFSLAILAIYRDKTVIATGVAVGLLQAFALFDLHGALVQSMWLVGTGACLFYSAHRSRADLAALASQASAPRPAAILTITPCRDEPDETRILSDAA
jgi:hypothetical protein